VFTALPELPELPERNLLVGDPSIGDLPRPSTAAGGHAGGETLAGDRPLTAVVLPGRTAPESAAIALTSRFQVAPGPGDPGVGDPRAAVIESVAATPGDSPARDGHDVCLWSGTTTVNGRPDIPVRLARCCLPLPGDEVVGLVLTHGIVVSVHRQECTNAVERNSGPERVRLASWEPIPDSTFPTEIAVEAFDRYGLLADITEVLCDASAAVRSASTVTSDDRVAHARFTIEVDGPAQLNSVLVAVRRVDGVYDCYRAGRS
jgi:GTP pyrophosphokinase